MKASYGTRTTPPRYDENPFHSCRVVGIFLMTLVILLPTSSDACDDPPRYESMMLKNVSEDLYHPGDQIEFKCRPGYMPIIPLLPTIALCLRNNTWTPLQEACTGKLCPQLAELLNGQVVYVNGNYKFGSQAQYICNEGYSLLGPKILYCELSGNNVDWSDTPPQCEKILCQPPATILNGKYTNSHKDVFEYNEVVTYSCNPSNGPDEYSLVGERRLICSGKNKWSSDPPECKVVKCQYPVVQNGIQVSGFGRKYYYNAVVGFECVQGFQLNGSSTIVCGADSMWNPAIPQCVKATNVSTSPSTKPTISSVSGASPTVPATPPVSSHPVSTPPSTKPTISSVSGASPTVPATPPVSSHPVSTPPSTKPTISSVSGASPTVPATPPVSSHPDHHPDNTEDLDDGLIAVIVLTVLAGIVLVGTRSTKDVEEKTTGILT